MASKALEKKQATLKQLKEKIEAAKVLVFSNYSGFSVKEITGLRKKLRQPEAEFKIYKNTLFVRAMQEAGFAALPGNFNGPTAVLLGYKDPIKPIKILVEAIKEYEKGEIKVGVVEKTVMGKEEILQVAKLPSRAVLLGKVMGGLQSPLYALLHVFNGPARKLVYALNAIKDLPDRQVKKKGGEQK